MGKFAKNGGIPSPFYLMGDSIYPFQKWLQKGYPRTSSFGNHDRVTYNKKFSQTRWVIEAAIGKLKGQWRCLYVGLRGRDRRRWVTTTRACIVLHNITIDKCGQGLKPGKRGERPETGTIFTADPDGVRVRSLGDDGEPEDSGRAYKGATGVRDALFARVVRGEG